MLSHIRLFANVWTIACQAPLSMGFPRQEYWRGLPFLSAGDLPNPGIEPTSPALAGGFFTTVPLGDPVSGSCMFKRNKHNGFLQVLLKLSPSSNPGTLDLDSLTCLLSEKAKEFLVENRVQSFYQQELETVESLLSLANQPVIHSACSGQVSAVCPREKSRPLPQICSWKVWVDMTVALRLTGCTQSVEVMLILFWKGHWPLRIWKENGRALFPSLISWSLNFG